MFAPEYNSSKDTFANILSHLAEYIACELDSGITEIPVTQPLPQLTLTSIPALTELDVASKLEKIAVAISRCQRCLLHKERKLPVPGEGSCTPEIMFIGEAPGFEEDCSGRPFVGAAGELLTRMIEAMNYKREEVFIANVIKCRPPANRSPYPEEVEQCLPYLNAQIDALKPRVIVALGATVARAFFGPSTSISKIRGNFMSYMNIPVMPTYHPAFLLRNPASKKEVWDDLRKVLALLGRISPGSGK